MGNQINLREVHSFKNGEKHRDLLTSKQGPSVAGCLRISPSEGLVLLVSLPPGSTVRVSSSSFI